MSAIGNPVRVPSTAPVEPSPHVSPGGPGTPWYRKWLILAVALAVVGALAYQFWLKPTVETPAAIVARTAKVTRGPLERTLRISGITTAHNFANIVAPNLRGPESGKFLVLMKLVKAGALVHKGELIALFDGQSTADHIDDIQDTIRQAKADVEKRKAEQAVEWETTLQTVRVAKSDWEKALQDVRAADVKTDIERELLQLAVEETAARYQQEQKDLANRKAYYAAELRILELTAQRHARHMERHQHDLEKFTVYAPIEGLAVMQPIFRGGEMGQIQEGDQIYPGQPFMKIVDPKSMQVEASANQAETSDLRLGQVVHVGVDAFPGLNISGKIRAIGALAVGGGRQNAYIRNVPVRCTIDSTDARLIPDLSAFADVVLGRTDDAVQVPLAAVHRAGGKPFVLVKNGAGFDRRDVTLGMHNEINTAVTDGVEPGEEVRVD
ncbi:MAG: efflux RND transporter periplasmic adaptor subunit [Bryobacteraceae bacterium]